MTYAGHTVWNVHAEAGAGRKRRPRSEWVIQRDTHEALITDAEADTILSRLEGWSASRGRDRGAGYLLAGLLVTKEGATFHGDRGAYRVKGRQVQAEAVDKAVAEHVLRDIQTTDFVKAVTAAARRHSVPDDSQALRKAVAEAEARSAKLTAMLEKTTAVEPILRKLEAIEGERQRLANALMEVEQADAERAAMSKISEIEVRRLLVERASAIEASDPEAMRTVFQSLLAKVVLDGSEISVHYRLASANHAGSGLEWRPHGAQNQTRSIYVKRRYKIG
jgi:predicted subunit of tRNA(5-methylaminomethyl-2-thiouridylate) methyltransferase